MTECMASSCGNVLDLTGLQQKTNLSELFCLKLRRVFVGAMPTSQNKVPSDNADQFRESKNLRDHEIS